MTMTKLDQAPTRRTQLREIASYIANWNGPLTWPDRASARSGIDLLILMATAPRTGGEIDHARLAYFRTLNL